MTHTHTHTHTYRDIHTLNIASRHTLVIVTDTHQHIDRGLYTYMTSYLAQAYRLSINTRSLSIVIDKPSPLSIGIPLSNRLLKVETTKHARADAAWKCLPHPVCSAYCGRSSSTCRAPRCGHLSWPVRVRCRPLATST